MSQKAAVAPVGPQREMSNKMRMWRKFIRNPVGVVGTVVFASILLASIFAPYVAPQDPTAQNLRNRMKPPLWQEGGTTDHILGTDQLGRDVLSRIIWGSRVSLFIGLSAVFVGATIGSTLGLVGGMLRGRIDNAIMLVVDIMLAFPALVLALAFAVVLGPGMWSIILVLALVEWARYARLVRGDTLAVREREFVQAARAMGQSTPKVMLYHIFPNVLQSVIVMATLRVAAVILTEASLSFLGLGTGGRVPSWGMMVAHGREVITRAWWLSTLPGLAIVVTVISINLVGDRIRDVFDPRVT